MPRPKKTTLVSFRHAFDGIGYVLRTHRWTRIYVVITGLVMAAGAWVRLAREQWFLVYFAIALVFVAEMVHIAVEACVDLFIDKNHPAPDTPRHVAAGAVLVAHVLAVIIVAMVFLSPPF